MWKLDWVRIGWKRIRKVFSGHPETSGAVGSWISFVISTEEKSNNIKSNENFKENHNNFSNYNCCNNYNDF